MMTEIKYRTLDELLSDIAIDLPVQERESMIEPAQLIKVVQRINYELGLKLTQNRFTILDICDGVAKLPDDFSVMNFAMLSYQYNKVQKIITGTQREDI